MLPSAEVSPSQLTVEVGDPVNVLCAAEGTEPLIIGQSQFVADNLKI